MKSTMLPFVAPLVTALALGSCKDNEKAYSRETAFEQPVHIPVQSQPVEMLTVNNTTKKKIRLALLLDTSNSMDGLIDQAKAQLWKLVEELNKASYGENEKPELEIALYEYGNSRLALSDGYIRQVMAFTGDLDAVSEKLFELTTNGGDEFCGQVIQTSLAELKWEEDHGNLQFIFIAGNEPFTQGNVDPRKACMSAANKDVYVNTIYCGNREQGIKEGWQLGAQIGHGFYMNIDQDQKTEYITTPYDTTLARLNDRLNGTYVYYGVSGAKYKSNQEKQDQNASSYGISNLSSRVSVKSSKVYNNKKWDLVDASKEKSFEVKKLSREELPEELKNKSDAEKQAYIDKKSKEREAVITEITLANAKREQYIAVQKKIKAANGESQTLDGALIASIRQKAVEREFRFPNQ